MAFFVTHFSVALCYVVYVSPATLVPDVHAARARAEIFGTLVRVLSFRNASASAERHDVHGRQTDDKR